MKIGLVRRGFSPTGGAEAYLRRFAQALVQNGDECLLFGSREWAGKEWPFGELRLVEGGSPTKFADALQAERPRARCDLLFSLERLWNCDCYRAGDGVHRAWLERREQHEPWWESWFRRLRPKHRELLALEARMFTPEATKLVIANSNLVRDEIVAGFGYPQERVRVIYNGVPLAPPPLTATEKQEARRTFGLEKSDYVVLFAGSGWERKGLNFAIAAINAAPSQNLVFLVAGSGKKEAVPISPRTRFLGPVRDMPRLLAAADVFLLPTLYDPFSNACLEAMASGLPVITTCANGFAEVLPPDAGDILDDPTDAAAMGRAITDWSDDARRKAAVPLLRDAGARFNIEANLRQTLAALAELLP
jgi:UDP-glucose:(heptosyl)LPS alpha-1,3-glucosyltransferase